ncbi:hypothetical protein GGX14DRAFT_561926 [Mycena pura]|uniref:Uncharacterized protein n=1 Tax=Mycena pura TaxID=153505 RepID=A0AAD6VLB0_9AGAR|nr:hypothetical protein GGX14DRAFT_561926 [Mycena pura]
MPLFRNHHAMDINAWHVPCPEPSCTRYLPAPRKCQSGANHGKCQGSPRVPPATAPPATSTPLPSTLLSTAPPASTPSAVQTTSTLPSTAPPTAHPGHRAATQPKHHKYTSAPSSGAEAHATRHAPGPRFLFYVPPEYN